MKSQTPFPVVPYPIATRSYNLRRILIALGLRSLKSREMRIVSLIDEEDVIERILRHLGLWQEGGARAFRHRPAGRNDPRSVARRPLPRLRHRTGRGVLRHLKRPAAPKCASCTPCSAAPSPPAAAFDFRAHFCHSAPMETHAFGFRLRANAPEGQKRFPISSWQLPCVRWGAGGAG